MSTADPAQSWPPTVGTSLRSAAVRATDLHGREPGDDKRLLFISYAFPPTGGGGVQRSVKFTKYLPEYGWRSTVLTAANPSVPVQDRDLQDDLDESTTILHARTMEPSYALKQSLADVSEQRTGRSLRNMLRRVGMYLLQPDPQLLWNPGAMRTARRALHRTPHDAIYVTGPPFSSFLLGRALKRRFRIPLIVDFRDEWLLVSRYLESYQIGPLAYDRQRRMMTQVLRSADAIVATTRASVTEIERHCRNAGISTPATCIYNGYDEDDIVGSQTQATAGNRFRLVYTGTLWNLTDVTPLVSALVHLSSVAPQAAGQVDVVLAGRSTAEQDSHLNELDSTPISVQRQGYVPHRTAIDLAASSDILLMLLADQPGAERVVPAKLFEYLALRKPILAICPDGETADLLRNHGQMSMFNPCETENISRWLEKRIAAREMGADTSLASPISSTSLHRFSRRALTGELAQVLDRVTSPAWRGD